FLLRPLTSYVAKSSYELSCLSFWHFGILAFWTMVKLAICICWQHEISAMLNDKIFGHHSKAYSRSIVHYSVSSAGLK
ncbi:hypothetical protein BC937DRAFT_88134, partial [Endogone sp. FLAS-F59071]